MSISPSGSATGSPSTTFALPASAAGGLGHEHLLLYLLGIPAIVPAAAAAYAAVGERQQGTLEPVLTTPIRGEELVAGKELAAPVPSVAVAYAVYACFLVCVGLFARPGVAAALLAGNGLGWRVTSASFDRERLLGR